ncbi:hypothetical protein ACLUV9_07135 [Limosilactobacillus balticus]|uniref:hypothetical protein n=1 Tax=Limosilactobacillus balticus TaxID=2759747 RepID=UPI00399541AA
MPDFFIQKEDICCPLVIQSIHHKNHERRFKQIPHNDFILNTLGIKNKIISVEEAEQYDYLNIHQALRPRQYQSSTKNVAVILRQTLLTVRFP